MDCFFSRSYYRSNKCVLKLMGQWPFQSSIKNKCLRTITTLIITSIYLPKMIKLLESLNNLDLVIECLPMLGLHSAALLKFFNWAIHENSMKQLLLSMEKDWRSLKNESEIKLLADYSERGRRINNIYASTLYGILLFYLSSPAIPKILDFLNPLNETRPLMYLYQTEYFIDQDKYYVHILIHAYMTVPISLTSILFHDNLFSILINHTCGMLEILKYNLESLKADDKANRSNSLEIIKRCADIQTNINEFIQCLESSYTIALLLIVGLNMTLITMTGMMVILKLDHPSEMLKFFVFNLGAIFHLFWSSWQGHILIVQSETVMRSTYQNEWYNLPRQHQQMLIPLMMRSLKPCQITAAKIYVMSMESFGVVMKATMSFLTLLLSAR